MTDKLATQMEIICLVIESRRHAREFDFYKELIEMLKTIFEIKQNQDLYFFVGYTSSVKIWHNGTFKCQKLRKRYLSVIF